MKYLLSLLTFAVIFPSFAQDNLWPSHDSEWYYSYVGMNEEGYRHYWIDRDTIIDGRTMQIYRVYQEYIYYNQMHDPERIGSNESELPYYIGLEDSVLFKYDS